MRLNLFGNLFGSNDNDDIKNGLLATHENLGTSDTKYNNLKTYIEQWSKLFEKGGAKQSVLTTPIKIVKSVKNNNDGEKEDLISDICKVET